MARGLAYPPLRAPPGNELPCSFGVMQTSWASQWLQVKNLPANAGDLRDAGSVPRLGRSPEEGNDNAHQYSCLENPMDGGAWWVQSIGSQRVGHD